MTTTQELLQAVRDRLFYFYGDQVPIYMDEQKEGFDAPSFFIREIMNRTGRLWNNRREKTSVIDVAYFSEMLPKRNIPDRQDMQAVQDVLSLGLEVITDRAGNPVRGDDIQAEIVDGVLHITVTYSYFILLVEPKAPYMETLTQNQNIGG